MNYKTIIIWQLDVDVMSILYKDSYFSTLDKILNENTS